MNISVRREDCKFIVNKEKNKVVCIYHLNDIWVPYHYLESMSDTFEWWKYNTKPMPRCIVGIATCAPEDEWNEEIGRFIAFYKVKNKFYSAFHKRIENVVEEHDKELTKMVDEYNKMGDGWARNLENMRNKIASFF